MTAEHCAKLTSRTPGLHMYSTWAVFVSRALVAVLPVAIARASVAPTVEAERAMLRTMPRSAGLALNGNTINKNVKAAKYAVRGNVLERSMELQRQMAAGQKLPFDKDIAEFITKRDNHPSRADRIFLTNGASEGVRIILTCLLRAEGQADGLLTPIPQYPLYSASLTLLGGTLVPYHLNESQAWGVQMQDLREALSSAREKGVEVRGIAVINPGNPTGNILSHNQIKDIIQMAVDEKLLILADEVYQANIWKEGAEFSSFKKVACDMGYTGEDGDERLQLVSFHSTSKGFYGECGMRGGYFEVHGIGPEVRAELYKLASLALCSNTLGQLATGIMINPPKEGDPSYPLYKKERDDILSSLQRRSRMVHNALNKMEGVTCNRADGALYAFPRIRLSKKAQEAADKAGVPADEFYCLKMLDASGIILVPGSGFGQEEGTLHFRTTFLPSEDTMAETMARLSNSHKAFMDEYRD